MEDFDEQINQFIGFPSHDGEYSTQDIKELIGDIDSLWVWGLHNVWKEKPNLFVNASLHFYSLMQTLNEACSDLEGTNNDEF